MFLPLNTKIGGPVKNVKDKDAISLIGNQAIHIYKKVESESIVNIALIKQEKEADKLGNNNNPDEDKVNPYHGIITNNLEKENIVTL